ncbi:MAG: histidine kinase [Bacteroidales bacterium]|nr:histidine kinase [Bacteroidales bacterium]MBN2817607.1 histidine kinase [Bacteroidales bacterium]
MKQQVDQYYKWLVLVIPLVGLLILAVFRNDGNDAYDIQPIFALLHSILYTAGIWIGCIIIVDFLWKKYPWENYPWKHLLLEVPLIFIYTMAFSYGIYKLEVKLGLIDPMEDIYLSAVITILITFLITSIHEAVEFYKQWKYNFSKSVRLEKDNIEARYETLKQQINPHFLFNSLNNLTTIVEDNTAAVEYIENLSEFLRYGLKSRDRELVLVTDELNFLSKYLKIQNSRFGKNLDVNIDIPKNFYHYSLPPLVLQMLVENCIKHNIISMDKPLKIDIQADKERISVVNNLQKKQTQSSTGNGLSNIIERYKFFTTAEVQVSETSSIFKVSIPMLLVEL